nr:uncharacterized protein LOC107449218 [Parasteatoda tepidariorum]
MCQSLLPSTSKFMSVELNPHLSTVSSDDDDSDPNQMPSIALHGQEEQKNVFFEDYDFNEGFNLPLSSASSDEEVEEIGSFLRNWYFGTNGVAMKHLTSLLKGLKKWHPELPSTAATLLKTPRRVDVQQMGSGEFFHFGLKNGIEKTMKQHHIVKDSLLLDFNIDGLPLFRSSRKQFWPILCRLYASPMPANPFLVSLFCGLTKPPVEEFLQPVVQELKDVLVNGIVISPENQKLSVKVRSFICDTPARCFIKCVKNFNGYNGCDRCVQHGERVNNRTVFLEMKADLRTDYSFEQMIHGGHHLDHLVSPLNDLKIGMVSSFPHDPMHLVYLGMMRKLLYSWKGKGSSHLGKLRARDRIRLDDMITSSKSLWPSDFAREPRSLNELDYWKATELRQFLLYLGPVLLKDILPIEYYSHFMLLFIAISIMSVAKYMHLIDVAKKCLSDFVRDSKKLYGKEFLIYNTHSLLHLPADAERLGPLPSFSAFPFENFLGSLKTILMKPNSPLQQVVKRLAEKNLCFFEPENVGKSKGFNSLKGNNDKDLPTAGVQGLNLHGLACEEYKLTTKPRDCVVLLEGNIILKIFNFVQNENGYHLIGKRFNLKSFSSFYSGPINMEVFDIFRVDELSESFESFHSSNIKCKAMLIKYHDSYVCVPLLHAST